MIEAGEMFVLQRAHDRLGERYRASLDRITSKLSAFDQNFRKDRERVFDELTTGLFEMRFDERVVDLMQRAGKLFAVTTSPLFATNEATDLPAREMDFASDRFAVVGMFLDQRNKNLVCKLRQQR
jgi:hypothetical protein